MYSYFVFWHDSEGEFHRLNVCTGVTPRDLYKDAGAFWVAVAKRWFELHKTPLKVSHIRRYYIISDPAHADGVLWPQDGSCDPFAFKLSGAYPGRSTRPLPTKEQ
jgi:hypothetical protein